MSLIDTVGFIRKLPHHIVASFRATIEEVRRADVLLHVIDPAQPDWEEQVAVVNEVLADLGVHGTPAVHVFNKMDLINEAAAFRRQVAHQVENPVFVSATGDVGELSAALERILSHYPAGW